MLAGVVHRDVAVDPHLIGERIDLDAAHVEDEAVGQRRVDAVVARRRLELRRRPHRGLAQRRRHAFRQHHRRPVRGAGDAAERHARCRDCCVLRILPPTSSTSSGSTLSCLAAMPLSLSAIRVAGDMRGDRGARREAAGIGAGGDRPLVLGGVHLQHDVDVVGPQAELVGDDLRQHGLVALPLHGDVGGHRHRAERIDVDRDHRDRAVLRAGLVARLGRQQRREIAHVRHAGLDHDGKADAVLPAGGARRVAPALEIVEPAVAGRGLDRAQIVAGIVERAGGGACTETCPSERDCA